MFYSVTVKQESSLLTEEWNVHHNAVKGTDPYLYHSRNIHSVYTVSSLSYFIVNICVYLLYIISIQTTVHGSSTQSRSIKDSCVLEVLYTDNSSIHYTDYFHSHSCPSCHSRLECVQ